jgi:hypothetical protein
MNLVSLHRLIRHAYSDGTYSYHYAVAEVNQDDASMNSDRAGLSDDPADRFTDWPPQPVIAWLES